MDGIDWIKDQWMAFDLIFFDFVIPWLSLSPFKNPPHSPNVKQLEFNINDHLG